MVPFRAGLVFRTEGVADIYWKTQISVGKRNHPMEPRREAVTHSPWRGTLLVAESLGSHPCTHPAVTQLVPYLSLSHRHTHTHTEIQVKEHVYALREHMLCSLPVNLAHCLCTKGSTNRLQSIFIIISMIEYLRSYCSNITWNNFI